MEFNAGGYGGYDDPIDNEIHNQIQRFGNIRFSNFLITISTNVVPKTGALITEREEEAALTRWLRDNLNELFNNWSELNGNVIKPAGSPNSDRQTFPPNNRIATIKSKIGIERGAAQRGQVHAHVVLEIMHRYDTATPENGAQDYGMDKDYIGVHINVTALREWLNNRIHLMVIPLERQPLKCYVNSRLLTKNNDNTNKWLTLAYISKDTDKTGRNLNQDKRNADPELQDAHRIIQRNGQRHNANARDPNPAPPQMVRTTRAAPQAPAMEMVTEARQMQTRAQGQQRQQTYGAYQRPNAPQPRNYR
jgi:hypothetical protein